MFKRSSIIILLSVLLITISSRLQPVNLDELLQHPEIQRIIDENPELKIKISDLLQKLPSDLDIEYLSKRIASIVETCSGNSELEYRLNALISDSEIFPAPSERPTWHDIPIRKANNMPLTPQEKITIATVLEDFQVNENTSSCDQWRPAVAADKEGNFVVAWEDARNGKWDDERSDRYGGFPIWQYDIYAQRYDSSGNPIGVNFRVNDDIGTAWQEYPEVAADGNGRFVIAWRDGRQSGIGDIYAQCYKANGEPDGTNYIVNDDTGNNRQYHPDIAMDKDGRFLIIWYDNRNGNYDIYAQHYDSSCSALGNNFKVNDNLNSVNHAYPAIDASYYGTFVLVWQDLRNGNYDIYAQRYNSSMQPLEQNFRVNADTISSYQIDPAIAVDGHGNFAIVWRDYRNDMGGDIYAQCFDNEGDSVGRNFVVNDDSGAISHWYPKIAISKAGNFVITWQDFRQGTDVYAQFYDSVGNSEGANFKVNDESLHGYYPEISFCQNGKFVITFLGRTWGISDIYLQGYNRNGFPINKNIPITCDGEPPFQSYPCVANFSKKILLAW